VSFSAEQVRAEVSRYWGAFSAKSADVVDSFYLPEAIVFASTTTRAEPGRLAATRRKREYFYSDAHVRVQLGSIDVLPISEDAAVACYTFKFHASRVAGALGKEVEENIEHGRVTQVFVRQNDGRLCILHEHISVIA
jgi:ketosteroid isomerase-like protein